MKGRTLATRGTRGTGLRNEGHGETTGSDVKDRGDLDRLIEGNGFSMEESDVLALCDRIRELSLGLHRYLRHGHLEKVYENGLAHRLRKAGIGFEQQCPLKVFDEDDTTLGEYYADFLVEGCLVVELRACRALADEHTAQLLGYLRASRMEHGLLINFGSPRLEIRKFKL